MTDERRTSARFSVNQCVTLSFARETFIDASGVDLGTGGMRFRSSTPIDQYQKIFVMLDTPEGTINAEGMIVHCESEGDASVYGLKFTDMGAEYRRILDAYCAGAGEGK